MSDSNQDVDFSLVLASGVHDMKNSVGMLIASLENFIDEHPPVDDAHRNHYNILQYEASRISTELVQLLTIYRMQNGRLPLRLEQHFVIDVLEDQIARNQALLESRRINFKLECDDHLEWTLDADLVGSVVQNVLVNCSRYTRTELLVQASVEDELLQIVVADDGSGYPPTMLVSPSQLAEEARVSGGSTHLGLYFADKIAALHKHKNRAGFIKLENGPPLGGGCFKMILP